MQEKKSFYEIFERSSAGESWNHGGLPRVMPIPDKVYIHTPKKTLNSSSNEHHT